MELLCWKLAVQQGPLPSKAVAELVVTDVPPASIGLNSLATGRGVRSRVHGEGGGEQVGGLSGEKVTRHCSLLGLVALLVVVSATVCVCVCARVCESQFEPLLPYCTHQVPMWNTLGVLRTRTLRSRWIGGQEEPSWLRDQSQL